MTEKEIRKQWEELNEKEKCKFNGYPDYVKRVNEQRSWN